VDHLIETGSNDVLVVRPSEQSIDDRERLIPWLEGDVILDVDIESQRICVRWHPDD
jgi:16S rRNA processing protein RimM